MEFIDIFNYRDPEYPFQCFIGGRGIGKTYSALSHLSEPDRTDKFIYMRRTQKELDLLLDSDQGEGANPFKPINTDFGRNLGFKNIVKDVAGIYQREESDTGKYIHVGAPIGYGVALSTISSIRSLDFSDCTDCVYDEFIPEKHVRKIKGECDALLNAYETICRNRELAGRPPLYLWLLANSNDIYNPIFIGLNIVSEYERMQRKGKEHVYIKERGLALHKLQSPEEYKQAKSQTALYKLTNGTPYYDMALGNDFAYNDFSLIEYRKLVNYIPFVALDKAYIYRNKNGRDFYVTYAKGNCPEYKSTEAQDLIKFKQKYGCRLHPYFVDARIYFESYELKELILGVIL